MKYLVAAIATAAIVVTSWACAPVAESAPQEYYGTVLYSDSYEYLTRVVDDEAGVVCWVYGKVNGAGIDCLPMTQTKMESSKK